MHCFQLGSSLNLIIERKLFSFVPNLLLSVQKYLDIFNIRNQVLAVVVLPILLVVSHQVTAFKADCTLIYVSSKIPVIVNYVLELVW